MGLGLGKPSALIVEKQAAVFDKTQISRGHLLWGRHSTWKEGKAGFLTSVTAEKLVVQYCPAIGNVTNHFIIPVSEAVEGQWEIRWSADLADIREYIGAESAGKGEPEGDGMDDAG